MQKKVLLITFMLSLISLLFGYINQARSESGFFSNNCSGCHSASTCSGCHAHGTHPDSSKSSLNISAKTDKTIYQPGETVSVTINGGYRNGWVRAILYNGDPASGGVEIARSTGPAGMGGGSGFPIILAGKAPAASGTYTFSASWYGNKYDKSGAFFGSRWRPDPNNPNHGEEIVATNSFTVVNAAPPPAPVITVTDSVSPTTDLAVPFGSVTSGASATQTVTVKNSGTGDLVIGSVGSTNALAAPFSVKTDSCSNQTIAPAASCTITVVFAPSTTGTFSDSLNIPSNDTARSSVVVNVSGDGATAPVPAISVTDSVSPTTDLAVPFGSVTSGASATQTVTVKNTGTGDLVIGSVGSTNALAAPFSVKTDSCSNQTLAAAAACTITVVFAPTTSGTFSDSFNIPSNDTTRNSVVVNMSGDGAAAPVPSISVTDSVTPNNDLLVPFGSATAGSSLTQTITVKNTGTANLVLGSVGSTNALAAPFSVKTDSCSNQTLAAAASCTITVVFAPITAGTFSDSFNIPSNDTAKSSVVVNVSGTGTTAAVPDITVTDSVAPTNDLKLDFGSILQATFREQTVTVKNDGTANLVLGSTGSGNGLAAPFSVSADTCSGKTLVPAASCTVTVKFAPDAVEMFSDSFAIPSNDPDEASVVIGVSGSGQAAPVADITVTDSVSPSGDLRLPFGSIMAGTSASQTVTIKNEGNADLVLGSIGSADALAAPFLIVSDTCSTMTIPPAGTCIMTIDFAPASVGNFADSFEIPSNDPDEAAVTVAVNGVGASTAVGDITVTDLVSPSDDLSIAFGDVRGGRTVDSVVTIANNADGLLDIGIIGSSNGLALPFSIVNDGCSNKALAAGETCTLTARFKAPTNCKKADEAGDDEVSSGAVQRCTYSDSFAIPSSDPDEESVIVQVSGASVPGSSNAAPGKPRLRYPVDGQQDLETSFWMKWEASSDPDGDPVAYEVVIAKDQTFISGMTLAGSAAMSASKAAGTMYAGTGFGFLVFGFAAIGASRGRKYLLTVVALLTLAGAAFVACGGSDSGDMQPAGTEVTRQVTDLQSGSTYFWKVVASDGKGGVTESDVSSFTTK